VPRIEIVERSDDMNGIVGPSPAGRAQFPWFGRNRRLAEDFENLAGTLETLVTLATIRLAIRRLART
jgi:hypothetical protein